MPAGKRSWRVLAEGFPPSLVTNADQTALEPNQTPNATGLDVDEETFLKKNTTVPTTGTRVVREYSAVADGAGVTATYELHYKRLWRISTAELIYGAPNNQVGLYLPQGSGSIQFDDNTAAILKFLPIGQTGLVVMKAAGSYIIQAANNEQGRFEITEFIEEAKISTATHCIELDGLVYFCNSDGLFSIDIAGKVEELSFPIRGDITPAAVTADYKNKYIKVASTDPLVFDVNTKRWFKYTSASAFTYETRQMRSLDRGGNEMPFSVDDVAFQVKWAAGTKPGKVVNLPFQVQVEDRGWSTIQKINAKYSRRQEARIHKRPSVRDTGRNFKVRLTNIPAELSIVRIWVFSDALMPEARDS